MKRIRAFVIAVLVTSLLTACEDDDVANATMTMTSVDTEATTVDMPMDTDMIPQDGSDIVTNTETVEVNSVVETAEADPRWEALVCDLTQKYDITDWENGTDTGDMDVTNDEGTTESVDKTLCTIQEAVDRLNIPNAVTAYLSENSSWYQDHITNDKLIRNITSGVKDFDSDGIDEMFYAINYLGVGWYSRSDIVLYRETDGVVYWNGNDTETENLSNVGYYFESDPVMQRINNADRSKLVYESYLIWEGSDMHFTDDNVFITANWKDNMNNDAGNRYYRVVSDSEGFHIEYVGMLNWFKGWEETESGVSFYRSTFTEGDIPCELIQ